MTKHTIPVGTTEPQDFTLKDAGEPIDGTGKTLALIILAKDDGTGLFDVTPGTPPTAAWLSAEDGTVRVTGAGTLAVGSYKVRFRLTAGGTVGYVPNGEHADLWQVVAIGNR